MIAGILLGIVAGLIANEHCEFSPWCARKLVRWSAFRWYTDPARAEMHSEELAAVINDRPGNLFKLITAVTFAVGAIIVSARHDPAREPDVDPSSNHGIPNPRIPYVDIPYVTPLVQKLADEHGVDLTKVVGDRSRRADPQAGRHRGRSPKTITRATR